MQQILCVIPQIEIFLSTEVAAYYSPGSQGSRSWGSFLNACSKNEIFDSKPKYFVLNSKEILRCFWGS